jgi:NhaC family Na+:H+ antiporter
MLDVSPAITAGAVISGAYLGDKTSPLSETTILTAQMVGVNPYEHIKRQVWTSVPAFGIALITFFVLGFIRTPDPNASVVTETDLDALGEHFWINPVNLLPLVLLAVMSVKKVPASLALLSSALFAGVLAAFTQPDLVAEFVGGAGNVVTESIKAMWQAMATGFHMSTGVSDVDRLVSRGGMDSMLLTLWLIFGAVTFGTILEKFGLITRLIDPMIASAHSTGRLFVTVLRVVSGSMWWPVINTSRWCCLLASFGLSLPSGAWRPPISLAWPQTAARSLPLWCRGIRAAPSWARLLVSPPCSTCPTPFFAMPVQS